MTRRAIALGAWGLAVAATWSLAGCLILPTPEHGRVGPRAAVAPPVLAWLTEARPTREEVLFALGGPEAHSADGAKFVYSWARVGGYYAVGAYYAGAAGEVAIRHFLVVEFDGTDRVRGIAESRNSPLAFQGWDQNESRLLRESGTNPAAP